MRLAAVAVLLALAFAGCASPQGGAPFQLSGSFTAERTQADLDEFHGIVDDYAADVAIMESFPEQFSIRGIVGGCEQLRSTLEAKDYVASVGACTQETQVAGDGDAATSSP